MANQTQVDDPSIQNIITAMQDTVNACATAGATADAVRGSVAWTGNASQAYKTSLDNWVAGLGQINTALGDLENAMGIHLTATNTAEDNNTGYSNWYQG
ncbi:MAG TPA: hypothetical protein VHA75_20585 [Rugosimonospora sp.]|nr:hypothetical protein [Rugosimonospora sp.]